MTQRSILAGKNPTVIIKAGGSVTVRGHEGDLVTAQTDHSWGLKVERRAGSEIGRARAAVGDHVLFDVRLKVPGWEKKNAPAEVTEVQLGGSGEVWVPFGSNLKIYAGKDIDVQAIKGQVDAYSGFKLRLGDVYCLGHASAGSAMDLDCQTLRADKVEFRAGGDIRFRVQDLASARIQVRDLGGYWEGRIGAAEKSIYLKCGGDVTLVTDQKVEPMPPDYILGKIEKPPST